MLVLYVLHDYVYRLPRTLRFQKRLTSFRVSDDAKGKKKAKAIAIAIAKAYA
jgi:hypothetical protein